MQGYYAKGPNIELAGTRGVASKQQSKYQGNENKNSHVFTNIPLGYNVP